MRIHVIIRTEATVSLLNTILFIEREVETNAFKSSKKIERRELSVAILQFHGRMAAVL